MSILQRAAHLIGRMVGPTPLGPRLAKAAPYLWSYAAKKPAWSMLATFITWVVEGFETNPLIYQALMYKVRAAASTRLTVQLGKRGSSEEADDTHPLAMLLTRPNLHQSWVEFESMNILALNVAGNCFIYLDRGASGAGPIEAMYGLRPDRVRIIPEENGVKGFVYVPQGVKPENGHFIMPDQMIHVKLPNPRDEFEGMGYGMSPMLPLSQSADVDNGFTGFIKLMVDHGLMPAGLLKFDVPLEQKDMDAARARFMEKHGGAGNWSDVIVLDSGGDYKPLAQNFKDIDFSTIDKRNETRILGVIGVPTILLETVAGLQNSTYSNKAEARKAFWEDTMMFELNIFDVEYDHYFKQKGVFIQRDYSGVPALQKNTPDLVKAAADLWKMGMPLNQALRTVGLKAEEVPGGDIGYIPGSVTMAGTDPAQIRADQAAARLAAQGQQLDDDEQPDEDEQEEEAEQGKKGKLPHKTRAALPVGKNPQSSALTRSIVKGWTQEKKSLIWKDIDNIAQSHEDDFGEAAVAAFKKDKRAILAIVKTAQEKALYRKSTINWLDISADVTQYLTNTSPAGWRSTFLPMFGALIEDTGNYWSAELGTSFDVRNVLGELWFQTYTLTFAQPINATSGKVIHEIIAQAQEEGWSVYEMTERMGMTFDQWMNGDIPPEDFAWIKSRTPFYRREMIARTETTRLQNSGAYALFTDWDINRKEWLSTQDDRCRPTHAAANGQTRDMDKPFMVGGFEMMHPGDTNLGAPVGEIVDCRCTTLPLVDEE